MKKFHRRVLLVLVPLALCIAASVYWLFLWSPAVKWDHSPDALILFTEPGNRHVYYGEIPKVQVWGDGHIVWVTYNDDGYRQVLEGYLSENQMEDLINQFIQAGFFKPLRNFFQNDFPGDGIYLHLLDAKHGEPIGPDNSIIYELVNYLGNGTDLPGTPFIPIAGQLFALPIEETEFHGMDVSTPYIWPEDRFGYNLETTTDGYFIEGDQLTYVWEIVNSPMPFAESEGKIYWIAFVIPGISY